MKLARILIVDDQRPNVILLDRMLRADGFTNIVGTTDPLEVEALYRSAPFDLILLDLAMPQLDGFGVMERLRTLQAETGEESYLPVLVLTAQPDRETRLRALKAGAKDFVGKPFDTLEVMTRIRNMLEVRLSHNQLRAQNERLDRLVSERSRELDEARVEMLARLGRAAAHRDNETGQHIARMSSFCACVGRRLGLPEKECAMLGIAARMHDIGKIGTPDQILLKPGKLDADEWAIMRQHTTVGHAILSNSGSPLMQMAATIALSHHEKWDGSGYPQGLAGEAIPLYGRIASVCDVFDALTMERPYKRAWSVAAAAALIREESGRHFDPGVAEAFLAALPEIEEIKERHADIRVGPHESENDMSHLPNPLLDFSGLPRFDAIAPTHVPEAIHQLLGESRALVERLTGTDVPATWQDFAAPLGDGIERLSRAWGIVGHLHSVNDVPEWRDAYNAQLPEVSRFYAELGQNLALFAKYRALRESGEYASLSPARRKIVDNEIRDFRLSGAELPEEKKPRFQAIQEELASLSAKFSENLLDATNAFAEFVEDEAELAGLPTDAKEAARAAAEKDGKPGWKFTLHMPSYLPVMQYADSRRLRAAMYRAYATRAAEFGPAELDNAPLIRRILELRREEAQLLGYANFAEVSLVPKMAESVAQVLAFLHDLAAKAKPFAEKDITELREFARKELGLEALEPWDVGYVSDKLQQARYAFSEQEVKPYFTEPKVLAGLFAVIERLFQVKVLPDTAPVWHEDVRFFRIVRADGELVGQFYLDLYARDTKRGGAWMDEALTRRRTAEGIQKPVAYLNCNFSRPVGNKPATFTHDEVNTLFHETGHGLHHLLTRGEELGVSGIHGVEWDAVELPSQFMENYCWEWSVLQEMTGHVDTGAPLPRELFDKMMAARNFQSGMQAVRQIEFSLFDLLLHGDFDPAGEKSVLDLLAEVRREVAVIVPPEWHRFPNSFSHIFAGGYAAGYFSYKWAEVLSADCYAAFEEAGDPFDAETGRRFLAEILSAGGERPALESFRAFRGRNPEVDALLRHSGMVAA